jgi:NAD(P)-dependent dehydrogenase (short-subunit alcohol dehydrogenase family)
MMARVFITGSSDGLGRMAAKLLVEQGHRVTLHARNRKRADEALSAVPGAETALIGDLASISQTRRLAEQANQTGRFDAVIHNAGMGYREPKRIATEDGLPEVLAVNALAPYVLTALMERPKRLIYISSGRGEVVWTRERIPYAAQIVSRRRSGRVRRWRPGGTFRIGLTGRVYRERQSSPKEES